MRTGGGKRKGSAFERKIAKDIVKAFSKFGITQRDCWRSTLSGGHSRASGDLELSKRLETLLPFSFECKHVRKIRWENMLLSKKSEERRWIKQVEDGARKFGLAPVLVARQNGHTILALVGECWDSGAALLTVPGSRYEWQLLPWKTFIKNAAVEANDHKANAST